MTGRGTTLRLALGVFGLGLGLVVAELVILASGVDERLVADLLSWQWADDRVHRVSSDAELLYELVPGAFFESPEVTRWGSRGRRVSINSLGFRDRERSEEKTPGTLRILAVGGSNTYGALVHDEETWPRRLEEALRERTGGPVEVWNFGVLGYVHRQKRRQLELWSERLQPDMILVQLYNAGPRLHLRSEEGRLEVLSRPDLWREHLAWAPTSGPLAALWRGWKLYRLAVVVANRRATDGSPPIGHPACEDRWEERDDEELERLLQEAEDSGVPWLTLRLPMPEGWRLGSAEAPAMLDIWSLLGAAQELEGAADVHPPAAVYEAYGDVLADEILRRGLAKPGPSAP